MQLEEFEMVVVSSYGKNSTDDTKDRHHDFLSAMENQISRVERSWYDSGGSTGKPLRPWVGAKDNKFSGHRRAASASADIGCWKIILDEENISPRGKIEKIPRKMPSFSGLLNTLESASKLKWPKNGYRKLSQEGLMLDD